MRTALINGVELTEEQLLEGLRQINHQKQTRIVRPFDVISGGDAHYLVLPKGPAIFVTLGKPGSFFRKDVLTADSELQSNSFKILGKLTGFTHDGNSR
jgi:hypothetical protein